MTRIDGALVAAVAERLRRGARVRRLLPGGGRIHVDRSVPFLCVYRGDPDGDAAQLVLGQPSYLLAPAADASDPGLPELVGAVARELRERTGGFLLVELWEAAPAPAREGRPHRIQPRFRLLATGESRGSLAPVLGSLEEGLRGLRLGTRPPEVEIELAESVGPPAQPTLLPCPSDPDCHVLGLALEPYYRNDEEGLRYPTLALDLAEGLGDVLQRAFYAFCTTATRVRPEHPHALGRRTLARAAWNVDRRLEEVHGSFDFLLQVTPINGDQAWEEFAAAGYRRAPRFLYRPLTVDPQIAKRNLFAIPVERVEDPLLGRLFREKQEELDRQLSLLVDRGTPRFLYGSIQLYGAVEPELLRLAERILAEVDGPSGDDGEVGEAVEAREMCARAEAEIAAYRSRHRGFAARVELRSDIASGLLVSRDRLLVARSGRFPARRVEALLHHEVGTHLLTYFNGKSQRIRQFYCGLAGYEALQEGVAVLAEYLCGGLTPGRLRVLAARVLACHDLVRGEGFVSGFRRLVEEGGLRPRAAFRIATRVHRGGGLTKDAVYLRGLVELVGYLRDGGELDPLFVGKLATRHLPVVKELYYRNFFQRPPVAPRYLSDRRARERLEALREGGDLLDLLAASWGETREELA